MLTILAILCALVVIGVTWWVSTGNYFRQLLVKIDESESGIDVALTKRYDVLTKMLAVCKQYAAHEEETFAKVIQLRNNMTMAQRSEVNGQMDTMLGKINVLAEAYPQLLSSEQYKQLQLAIRDVEEHLQAARRFYNSNISSYNQSMVSFPNSLVGSHLKMVQREFFEVEAYKRQDVSMN